MTVELELQIASENKTLPHPSQFREWVGIVLTDKITPTHLVIRVVDIDEMTLLNEAYRKKSGPTNVLAFPSIELEGIEDDNSLGDIVICAPIVEQEATSQEKKLIAHWAHLVIHGTLHLLGYDHQTNEEAEAMEALETKLILQLGFDAPYGG